MKKISLVLIVFLLPTALAAFTMGKGNYFYHYDLGLDYMKFKRYDLAAQEFEKAIKINPEEKSVYILAGRAYMALGELEAGKEKLLVSLKLDEGYRYSHKYLGRLCFLQGKREDQAREQGQVVKKKPQPQTEEAPASEHHIELCDYDHAVRYLKNAVYVYASDYEANRWLAESRQALKKYREREAAEKKAREELESAAENVDAEATKAASVAKKAAAKAAKKTSAAEKAMAAVEKAATSAEEANLKAKQTAAEVAEKTQAAAEAAVIARAAARKAKEAAEAAEEADVATAKAAAEKAKQLSAEASKAAAEASKAAAAAEKAEAKASKAETTAVKKTKAADQAAEIAKKAAELAKQAAADAAAAEKKRDELKGKSNAKLPELNEDVKEMGGTEKLPDLPPLTE